MASLWDFQLEATGTALICLWTPFSNESVANRSTGGFDCTVTVATAGIASQLMKQTVQNIQCEAPQ